MKTNNVVTHFTKNIVFIVFLSVSLPDLVTETCGTWSWYLAAWGELSLYADWIIQHYNSLPCVDFMRILKKVSRVRFCFLVLFSIECFWWIWLKNMFNLFISISGRRTRTILVCSAWRTTGSTISCIERQWRQSEFYFLCNEAYLAINHVVIGSMCELTCKTHLRIYLNQLCEHENTK